MKYFNSKKGGYLLIQVLIFGTIAVVIIGGLVAFATANARLGRRSANSEQAFEAAEAGVEYYRWHLAHAPTDYTNGTGGAGPYVKNFYDKDNNLLGTFALTITPPSASSNSVTIQSIGTSNADASVKRTLVSRLTTDTGETFHYGVQSGPGGFNLGNGSTVNGNVYSNGSISGGNGSSITGSAFAVGSITNVSASSTQTGVAPQALPISDADINSWKSDAATSTFVGTKTISGSNNSLGPMKIQGNLTLNGSAALTVTGTLWVTGNISLGNNAAISLSSSYGTSGGIIIADGTISFGNGVSLQGSGSANSYLMIISTSNSSTAISLGNGNAVSVMLYAPNGTIEIGNNANVRALAAKTINLGNNVNLNYVQGIIDASFKSGPSGGWRIDEWKEVY